MYNPFANMFKKKDKFQEISQDKYRNDVALILTPLGKQKALDVDVNNPKYKIVAALHENGSMTLTELAANTSMNVNKVREECKALLKGGFIKKVMG